MSVETKQAATKQIQDAIQKWLNTRYETAKVANAGNTERLKAIEEMRHLHLDDYWYTVAPKIAEMFIED